MKNKKKQYFLILICLFLSVDSLSFFYNHYKKNSINTRQNDLVVNKRISLRTTLSSHCLAPSQSINIALRHLKRKSSHEPSFQPKSKHQKDEDAPNLKLLLEACREENIETVEHILAKGIRLANQNKKQEQPLHFVYDLYTQTSSDQLNLKQRYFHIVQILIKDKDQLNCQDKYGNTLLHYACRKCDLKLIQLLLENEAQCDIQNNANQNSFHCLYQFVTQTDLKNLDIEKKNETLDIMKMLLIKTVPGIACEYRENNNLTTLDNLCHKEDFAKTLSSITHYVQSDLCIDHSNSYWTNLVVNILTIMIIEKKLGLNFQNSDGETILHYACSDGNLQLVELLLKKGARCDIKNDTDQTALHCLYHFINRTNALHFDIIKKMIEITFGLNAQDNRGNTVLHYACSDGNLQLVKILLHYDARCDIKNNKQKTPLHLAYAQYTSDKVTLKQRYFDIVEILIKHKNGLNCRDKHGKTILHYACSDGNLQLVELLVQNDAQCDIKNNKQKTPLHLAYAQYTQSPDLNLKQRYFDIVEILIKDKDGLNCQDHHGNTILHYACSDGHIKLVELLLHYGTLCDIQNNEQKTPLHCLCQLNTINQRIIKIIAIIIEKNMRLNCHESSDNINLDDASRNGDFELVHSAIESYIPYACSISIENATLIKIIDTIEINIMKKVGWNSQDDTDKTMVTYGDQCNIQDTNGKTPFHEACSHGNIELAKRLIQNGARCNIKDTNGKTPFHEACSHGNIELVEILLKNGARCNIQDNDKRTPLSYACSRGNFKLVEILLNHGALCNIQDNDKRTPLSYACSRGNFKLVEILLNHDARCDIQDNDKRTPLHEACSNENFKLVELLLQNGARCDIKDTNGKTPLHEACSHENNENLALVECLLNHGAQCDIQDNNGNTALYYACSLGKVELVELFVQSGVRYDMQDTNGKTLLHYACSHENNENLALVEILLNHSAQCDIQDNNGKTALHYACSYKNNENLALVKLFVRNGVRYDIKDNNGKTALHYACSHKNIALVELLVQNGAQCDIKNYAKKTPLDCICQLDTINQQIINIIIIMIEQNIRADCIYLDAVCRKRDFVLLRSSIKRYIPSALSIPSRNTDLIKIIDTIEINIMKKIGLNSQNDTGETMLHEACRKDDFELISLLLENGAPCNIKDKEGKTPLHDACSDGNLTLVDILLNHSARCDIQDDRKQTPLYLFYSFFKNIDHSDNDLKEKAYKLIKIMIETKLGLNSQDDQGNTLLHDVCSHNHSNIATLLVENGAQFNIQNTNKETPLDITRQKGFVSLKEYLLTQQSA